MTILNQTDAAKAAVTPAKATTLYVPLQNLDGTPAGRILLSGVLPHGDSTTLTEAADGTLSVVGQAPTPVSSGVTLGGLAILQADGTYLTGAQLQALLGTSTQTQAASPATAYTLALSSSSVTVGTADTVTLTPTGGAWPSGETLTLAASGLTGTFSPATLTPSGSGAVTATFTASAAGSGTISATSSPAMTNPSGAGLAATAAASANAATSTFPATIHEFFGTPGTTLTGNNGFSFSAFVQSGAPGGFLSDGDNSGTELTVQSLYVGLSRSATSAPTNVVTGSGDPGGDGSFLSQCVRGSNGLWAANGGATYGGAHPGTYYLWAVLTGTDGTVYRAVSATTITVN